MKVEKLLKSDSPKLIIKKCHLCDHVMESTEEIQKCHKCMKSFLPINYFSKVHAKNKTEFDNLFASSQEIHEHDLIKGLTVLW